MTAGPLRGVRVVELAGIGPVPFAGMLLADMDAEVVRVDRPTASEVSLPPEHDVLARGKRSIVVDLKHPRGAEVVLSLTDRADVLLEGFRPGVAERLGVAPEACLDRNPRLVYGRMTGWGQDGPWRDRAGHDIDYLAVAGALYPIGWRDRPPSPPLNLVGDFGGGGMLLAFGIVCALMDRARSGRGQTIDAAMVDGVAVLTAAFHGMAAAGLWTDRRESNLVDGGAPFYRTYACADGGAVAVGALEVSFYRELLSTLGLDPDAWPQYDSTRWQALRGRLTEVFASKPRRHWERVFAGSDACVAPVLSLTEAPGHEHLAARGTFAELAGVRQPAPAPRLSRTPGSLHRPPSAAGAHTDEVLAEAGHTEPEIQSLRNERVVR